MRGAGIVIVLCAALLASPGSAESAAEEAESAATAESAEAEAEVAATAKTEAPEEPAEDPAEFHRTLLEAVRASAAVEAEQDREREEIFRAAREEQARRLAGLEAQVKREEAESLDLDTRYGHNELEIEALGERLTERLGQMGELFGVVRLVATDMSAESWESLTSLGLGERTKLLDRLGRSTDLPSTDDLEALWYELQREMTEQGRIATHTARVLVEDARMVDKRVTRAGPFTAFADGGYLQWEPAQQILRELERQPPPRYVNTVEAYQRGGNGFMRLAVDPSRGTLLEALTDTPSLVERTQQGGSVGYTILLLGAFAVVLGMVRLASLVVTHRKVVAQTRRETPSRDNPLGRLLAVFEEHRDADPEALEQRLDEAVMRESAQVSRYLWLVQTVSIIAPLLGLLGTVTGMIQTFQAITLFGAGDPKIMAGGISEALVTTTLGLVTAIPLVLLYALLASRARAITAQLDERSASLLATRLAGGSAS